MKRLVIGFPLVLLLFTTACFSTTKITRVWSDAELVKKYNSVLVIAVSHRPEGRKRSENLFATQLGETGTKVLTSYQIIDNISGKKKRKLVDKIKSTGAEGVLVIRLIELKNRQEYEPLTAYNVPYPYYSKLQSYLRETNLDKEETSDKTIYGIAVAEANLYDIGTEKLVWTAVSDLYLQDSATNIRKSFVESIVKEMAAGGVI